MWGGYKYSTVLATAMGRESLKRVPGHASLREDLWELLCLMGTTGTDDWLSQQYAVVGGVDSGTGRCPEVQDQERPSRRASETLLPATDGLNPGVYLIAGIYARVATRL